MFLKDTKSKQPVSLPELIVLNYYKSMHPIKLGFSTLCWEETSMNVKPRTIL